MGVKKTVDYYKANRCFASDTCLFHTFARVMRHMINSGSVGLLK